MTNSKVNASIVRGTFYYLKKQYGIVDPEPYIMKKYFMQYVDSIFTIKDDIDLKDHNDAYIHIRGGDIFNRNPHKGSYNFLNT